MHRETDSTSFLLIEWAKWAWLRREVYLGYPGMTAFRRQAKLVHPPEPLISDVCAESVDQAVARVVKANKECGEILIRSYFLKQSYRKIARQIGCGKTRVATLLRLAEYSVAEILDAPE